MLRWIEKFSITEEIQLNDVSDLFSIICIIGPHAIQSMNGTDIKEGRVWQGRFGTLPCTRILSTKGTHAGIAGKLQEK